MEQDYCFYFEITNVVRNIRNTSAVFHISPFTIVKPAPVDYISFQNISDTCVTVVWNHSKKFGENVFRVRHKSECSSEQQFPLLERNATVCDLNPHTTYTFMVDSMPRNKNGSSHLESVGFMSDSKKSTVITSATVPAYNPTLLSYRDVFCSKTPCRHVLLYWEPLPPCDLHDIPSGLQYEIITKQRGSEEKQNYTADSNATSHLLMFPDEEKVYEVKLRVITASGKKREDFSHLVIWPRKQSPIAPSMVVEYATLKNGTDFYITLNLTEVQLHTLQILYWCKISQGSGCQKQMSYMEINGNSTKISIKDYKMDFNIIFGVESKERTQSGIQIVNCIYPKDQKPLIPPKKFNLARGIAEKEGELSLQWDPYDCNNPKIESGYVLSYTLYCCQVTDESSCNLNNTMACLCTTSVGGYIYNYTLKNLQPGSWYKVWLTARTSAGEGPPTDVICKDIFIQGFPSWGTIIISVGSLILILAIMFSLYKFYQHIKGRIEAFSRIEVPDTRFQFMNTDDYVQLSNCHRPKVNGHVIVDNQKAETIPDMDESEELNTLIPIMPSLEAKVNIADKTPWTGCMLDLWKRDKIQMLLETSFSVSDYKGDGSYISSNDINSASSDTESDRDIKDEKDITRDAVVLSFANLLPEGYCRAVGNGDYVTNNKCNSTLYEDRLDHTFFKLQGQLVNSQSIDSLLNDGPELQGLLLDECKGKRYEREKGVNSVCLKNSSNLPQEYVIIEKQIETVHETVQMNSKDDFESDKLSLPGDDLDDAASDDSLSLLDELCGSFNKTEKASGYVCANNIQDVAEESLPCFNYNEYSNLGKDILGSDDEHMKHLTDNAGSDSDHVRSDKLNMRSENDHLRSDANEAIYDNCIHCDYVNSSIGNSVRSVHKYKTCGNRIIEFQLRDSLKSFICNGTSNHDKSREENDDPAVIHPYMNIVQNGIPENQPKRSVEKFLGQNEN